MKVSAATDPLRPPARYPPPSWQIEAGKLELVSVTFDLRALVEDAVDAVAARAAAGGLEVCCFIDPAVPARAVGDPDRLRQVLLRALMLIGRDRGERGRGEW